MEFLLKIRVFESWFPFRVDRKESGLQKNVSEDRKSKIMKKNISLKLPICNLNLFIEDIEQK